MLENQKQIDEIIKKYEGKKGFTIPMLQDIQDIERYLSKDAMRYVSEKTGLKLAEIYGVATFYTMFRLKPQGRHVIKVCKGTACHVSGANQLLNAIKLDLGLEGEEDTTEDGKFTVMEVACLGCCSLAPVIMVDDNTHGKLIPENVSDVLKKYN